MRTSLTICILDLLAQILGSGLDRGSHDQEDTAADAEFPAWPGLWSPKLQGGGLEPLAHDASLPLKGTRYKGSWVVCERRCPVTEVPVPARGDVVTCTKCTRLGTRQWPVGVEKNCQLCGQGWVSGSQLCSQHLQQGTQGALKKDLSSA